MPCVSRPASQRVLRTAAAGLAFLGLSIVGAVPRTAADASAQSERHCVVAVEGQRESGELVLSPEQCWKASEAASALVDVTSTVIATHYTGLNFTGSSLAITGAACAGGWLNLPSGWVNVISSTSSICDVDHFDLFYRGGTSQRVWSPGGNLTTMDNRPNSVQYL